ncbi:MAG: MFS transporter [Candidatus Thermoplasmatota archaeon]|nr:MFS transporter [Candidatus Thermoplasmatota archaeon]
MSNRSLWGLSGLTRAGQDGARATARFYSRTGKDERRLVKASFYAGVTGGILWYVLIYYWGALGFESEEIGYMGGIGSAVAVIAYLVGGYMADRLGRKRLLLIGLVSTAAGLTLLLSERDLVIFTVAYSLTSLGGSFAWPSLVALMATKTVQSEMKFFYGIQGFVNQIGLTIATFLGIFGPPFLDDGYGVDLTTGFRYVFIATAVCAFVPILYVMKVAEPRVPSESLTVRMDRRTARHLIVYCAQNAMIGAGAALVIPWFPLIFKDGMGASDTWVAMIITLSNAVIAVGWFIVPKFAEIRGSVALIAVCQVASVAFMLAIPYSPLLIGVAFLYTMRSFLMLVPQPVLNAYLMSIASERIRASFLAISQVSWQLAFASSYAIAGQLWNSDYSKVLPFYIGGALYVLATLVFYLYFRKVGESDRDVQARAVARGPSGS